MGQIELFEHLTVCKQMTDVKLFVLGNNTLTHLTVYKERSNAE